MKVVLVEVGKPAKITDMPHDLKAMQTIVEGPIQALYPWDDPVALVCNEEGKLHGLPLNRILEDYDIIAGNFFLCGLSKDNFASLSGSLAKKYQEKFLYPERIAIQDGHVLVFRVVGQPSPPENKKNHDPER